MKKAYFLLFAAVILVFIFTACAGSGGTSTGNSTGDADYIRLTYDGNKTTVISNVQTELIEMVFDGEIEASSLHSSGDFLTIVKNKGNRSTVAVGKMTGQIGKNDTLFWVNHANLPELLSVAIFSLSEEKTPPRAPEGLSIEDLEMQTRQTGSVIIHGKNIADLTGFDLYLTFDTTYFDVTGDNFCEFLGPLSTMTPQATRINNRITITGFNLSNPIDVTDSDIIRLNITTKDQEGNTNLVLANNSIFMGIGTQELTVPLTSGVLSIVDEHPVLLGDFNHDNQVDIRDFAVFREHYGTSESDDDYDVLTDIYEAQDRFQGEWDGIYDFAIPDGTVDIRDFAIFRANYSKSVSDDPQSNPPTIQKITGPNGTTNSNAQTFGWLADDPDDDLSHYEIRKDSGGFETYSNSSYQWSAITPGTHNFYVKAVDSRGNESQTVGWTFTYIVPEEPAEKLFELTVQTGATINLTQLKTHYENAAINAGVLSWERSARAMWDSENNQTHYTMGHPEDTDLLYRFEVTANGLIRCSVNSDDPEKALFVFTEGSLNNYQDFEGQYLSNTVYGQIMDRYTVPDPVRNNLLAVWCRSVFLKALNEGALSGGPANNYEFYNLDFVLNNLTGKKVTLLRSLIHNQQMDYSWYDDNRFDMEDTRNRMWSPIGISPNQNATLARSFDVNYNNCSGSCLKMISYTDNRNDGLVKAWGISSSAPDYSAENSYYQVDYSPSQGTYSVSNDDCAYSRVYLFGEYPEKASMNNHSEWSLSFLRFDLAVYGDLSTTNVTESPSPGDDNNPAPFLMAINPGENTFDEEYNRPPTISKVTGITGTTYANIAYFEWQGHDPDGNLSNYWIKKDSGNWIYRTGTSYTYSGYSLGEHTFSVKAEDDQREESAVISWTFNYSQSSPGEVQYRALLTGLSEYANPANNLNYTDDDADKMQEVLQQFDDPYSVVKETGYVSKGTLLDRLDDVIAQNPGTEDVFYYHYSGHGFYDDEQSYLAMSDHNYVSVSDLRNKLDQINGTKIVVIDACQSGDFVNLGQERALTKAEREQMVRQFTDNILAVFSENNQRGSHDSAYEYYVLTGSSIDQYSHEDGYIKSGWLSFFVSDAMGHRGLDNLGGSFDNTYDADGYLGSTNRKIEFNELYRYVHDNVLDYGQETFGVVQTVQGYPQTDSFVVGEY